MDRAPGRDQVHDHFQRHRLHEQRNEVLLLEALEESLRGMANRREYTEDGATSQR